MTIVLVSEINELVVAIIKVEDRKWEEILHHLLYLHRLVGIRVFTDLDRTVEKQLQSLAQEFLLLMVDQKVLALFELLLDQVN